MAFNKDMAQALVDRAVEQIRGSTSAAAKVEEDVLTRMGMVGVMAAFIAMDLEPPPAVAAAVSKGRRLSTRRWRAVLKEIK